VKHKEINQFYVAASHPMTPHDVTVLKLKGLQAKNFYFDRA